MNKWDDAKLIEYSDRQKRWALLRVQYKNALELLDSALEINKKITDCVSSDSDDQ